MRILRNRIRIPNTGKIYKLSLMVYTIDTVLYKVYMQIKIITGTVY
jgi:hypothetical protein